jgi:glycosyltransferase involved in cell wall biosynthesis
VLHLRSSCGLYGAEGVIFNLVRQYRGEAVTACIADARSAHTELCGRLDAEGFATATLPARGAFDPGLLFRFAALFRRVKPDVVHTHEYKSDAIAYLVTRCMPLYARRVPLVATMHGVVRTTEALRRYERLDARLLRRFDAVIPVSQGTATIARDYGVPEGRIRPVANGVDTDRFWPGTDRRAARSALGLPPDGVFIGMVGRLSEEKGPDQLLEAFSVMGVTAERTHLVFVGDGPMEPSLRMRAQELGLVGCVHFLGRREDVERVYRVLDILALPSLTEGLPLTVLEASACGVPIVATDVGDVARVLPHEVASLLVQPRDTRALAAAMVRLLTEPEHAAELAETARCRVEAGYSARAMAESYEDVYRAVTRRPRPARESMGAAR